jgi:hypothetical protein
MPSINLNSGPIVSFLFLIATLVLPIVVCFQIHNQNIDNPDTKIQELAKKYRITGILLASAIGCLVFALLTIIATAGVSFLTNFGNIAIASIIGVSIIATILILVAFGLYVSAFVYLWTGYIDSLQTPIAPYGLLAAISFTIFLGFSAFSFMSNNAYLNFNNQDIMQPRRPVEDVSPFPIDAMQPPRPVSSIIEAGDITNLKPKKL